VPTVRVPAKVNLALSVGGPAADGFHPLATVFQAVSLYDHVEAVAGDPGAGASVALAGPECGDVPTGPDNLAIKAALLLADESGCPPDVRLTVRKEIPVAGGMAGGSADAAAALLACDALWGLRTPKPRLLALAAELGSDVPFAVLGGTALGRGRGDRLTPVLTLGTYHWVFALAEGGLSTPAVYREIDRMREGSILPEPGVLDALLVALRRGDPAAVGAALGNDLQRAAVSLRPQLQMTLEVAEEYGALGWLVSGSGPTVAALARDEEHSLDLAVAFTASGVCRSVTRATGPVPGARLVAN
jgi:4-diphosphocytidyl-2-C-methyl-D-erythritol kinase